MKMFVKLVSVAMISISLAHAEGEIRLYGIGSTSTLGTGFARAKKPKWLAPEDINCIQSIYSFKPENLFRLTADINEPLGVLACTGARFNVGARFTADSCKTAISCRNNIENAGVEVKSGEKALNDLIALDFIKNAMIVNGDEMERFQIMKKFAQEKFDKKLGSKCLNRFTTQGMSQCTGSLMEKAFEERQSECSYGSGCYKKDDIELGLDSYAHFKSKNDDKVGRMLRSYFNYRSENAAKKRLSEDDKRIEALAALATDAEFKKAKPEQKINMIVNAIGKDANNRLKDPILSFEFGHENFTSPKNIEKFKDILKMYDSKTASADFAKNFDAYRKERAEKRLNSENSCAQTSTMINICNEATLISQGKIVPKDAENAESYTSSNTSKAGNDYEVLKSNLGSKFDEEDYNTLLNARRCIAFGITDEWGNARSLRPSLGGSTSTVAAGDGRMNSDEARGIAPSDSPNDSDVKVNPNGTNTSIVDQTGIRGLKVPGTDGEKISSSDEVIGVNSSEEVGQFANAIGQVPQGQIGSNFADMYNASNFEAFSPKSKTVVPEEEAKPEEAQAASGAASTAQDKMNEYLMKKLAAAEENLEKLKADTAEAEEAREKQKKMDEETALIKDLKGQIADLKTQTTKNAERKIASDAAAEEESRSTSSSAGNAFSSAGAAVSSSRAEAPAPKSQSAEKFDANQAGSQTSQASSARSGSSSGAILSSVSNPDGSRTTTLGSGLVVTTVDGMSSEKAQQTISNRILELNGTPFYIEEGGMVKEIIAVVKDGKVLLDEKGNPIFEKIVKGKVGDKKFAIKGKDKKDRAPASITDVADLKRDQEEKLKRDRAEYIKLRNITTGALKKK